MKYTASPALPSMVLPGWNLASIIASAWLLAVPWYRTTPFTTSAISSMLRLGNGWCNPSPIASMVASVPSTSAAMSNLSTLPALSPHIRPLWPSARVGLSRTTCLKPFRETTRVDSSFLRSSNAASELVPLKITSSLLLVAQPLSIKYLAKFLLASSRMNQYRRMPTSKSLATCSVGVPDSMPASMMRSVPSIASTASVTLVRTASCFADLSRLLKLPSPATKSSNVTTCPLGSLVLVVRATILYCFSVYSLPFLLNFVSDGTINTSAR